LRLNRASVRREPETAGRYSFNHPKVGSDSFVRCMAQVVPQSRRDSVPGHSESVATGDQKTDGKNDPPIEQSCLTKNVCNTKIPELPGSNPAPISLQLLSARKIASRKRWQSWRK